MTNATNTHIQYKHHGIALDWQTTLKINTEVFIALLNVGTMGSCAPEANNLARSAHNHI